jgi:uncharacterized protein with HEPN domain
MDILQAIEGVREAVAGMDFPVYRQRRPARRAVEREIEIISGSSRRIPADLKATEPHIPWQDIAGIGNVLRHDYQIVSDQVVWNVVVMHLPPLEEAVRRMVVRIDGSTGGG